jgi:hypothetical protein
MKFIYFQTNDITKELNNLKNTIISVNSYLENSLSKDTNSKIDFVIYGGNFYNESELTLSNPNEKQCILIETLKQIKKLNKDIPKIIMFGNFDLNINVDLEPEKINAECNNFKKILKFYKENENNNFYVFNSISFSHKKLDSSLLIFFDSLIFNIKNQKQVLVSDTCYANLFDNFSQQLNINKDKTIKDLIDFQFREISEVTQQNDNLNKRNIIFLTQFPIIIHKNNTISILNKQFLDWIILNNKYFRNKNIIFITNNYQSDTNNLNQHIFIQIKEKIDDTYNTTLNFSQYLFSNKNVDIPKTYNQPELNNYIYVLEYKLTSPFTQEKTNYFIKYEIDTNINKSGFLISDIDQQINFKIITDKTKQQNKQVDNIEVEENKKVDNIEVEENKKVENKEVEENKQVEENNEVVEFEGKVINSKNSKYIKKKIHPKHLNNIEISENSYLDVSETDIDLNDPYLKKYLKYKAKLYKLRNNK